MADRRKEFWASSWERIGTVDDRRSAIRYPVSGIPALVAWSGERGFRMDDALLRNLSLGGALALTDERLPDEGRVRVSLGDVTPPEWLEATIVRVRKSRILLPGPFLVSLQFSEACPYEVFKRVVSGFGGRGEVTVPELERRSPIHRLFSK